MKGLVKKQSHRDHKVHLRYMGRDAAAGQKKHMDMVVPSLMLRE